MAKYVSSPDISVLDFSVLMNLSLAAPVASITNLSTMIFPGSLVWVFEFYSPSGTPLYKADFTNPSINGTAFTTFPFPDPIQQIFGQIEYSNINSYTFKVLVKDSTGAIFDLSKGQPLCKPNGNNGKNNFGAALIDIKASCVQARLLITDKTNLLYKSLTGTLVSSTTTLNYPTDPNGNMLAPVTVASLPAILPIKYEGEGYEVYTAHIMDYDLGDYFIVRIRYSYQKVFPVWCNVQLEPLFCELDKMLAILQKCGDSAEKRENTTKLTAANTKLAMALTGIAQPQLNLNVPEIIEEIKDILVIECECCRPQGISPIGTALATDAIFVAQVGCGDITASFSNDGLGNIVLHISDKTYLFQMSPDPASSIAFEFKESTSGCAKTTTLYVDKLTLAGEVLYSIKNDPVLLDYLQSMINATQGGTAICSGLDGKGIFDFSTCDYAIELNSGTTGSGSNTVYSILIAGTTYNAPPSLLVSNATGVQSWLNGLSKGNFVVSYTAATKKLTIISADNPNKLASITIFVPGIKGDFDAQHPVKAFNTECGSVCAIIQDMINYLAAINLLQVKGGFALGVCTINPVSLATSVASFTPDSKAIDIVLALAQATCDLSQCILKYGLNCTNLKALFADFTNTTGNPNGADVVLMFKNGACQQVPLKTVALSVFQMLSTDTDVKSMYCLGAKCDVVNSCSPVSNLTASITDTQVAFTWTPVNGATSYKYSTDGHTWLQVQGTTVFLTGLTPGTAYTFRIFPVYNSGDGNACTVTQGFTTTNSTPCVAPTGLVLDNVTAGSFRATWVAVTGASGYQYRINGGGWINAGLVLTATVSGLTPDTNYNFEVAAIIGGTPCVESSTASTRTAVFANYTVSASYNYDITSVTGIGVPNLGSTGVNGSKSGVHTAMSGNYTIIIAAASAVPGTHLDATVDGAVVATTSTAAGTGNYTLAITADAGRAVRISLNL